MKAYTDWSQSKKLAEILPLESADMYRVFENNAETRVYYGKPSTAYFVCEPCWSLAALFGVLPDTITSNDGVAFKLNIKKSIIEYSNPSLYLIYKSIKAYNPVDACYEMILKLHELNLL